MACASDEAPPTRLRWGPDLAVGHALIDTQHRGLVDQCNLLAEHCAGENCDERDHRFDQAFDGFKALVRGHFETEASLLAGDGKVLEDHLVGRDEFEYLVDEVATAANFERPEIQRFLAVWCVGHIRDSAVWLRSGDARSAD